MSEQLWMLCEHGEAKPHWNAGMARSVAVVPGSCPGGHPVEGGHEITLEPDHEIHNGTGESMGMGCYPRGDVVGGDGECALFALPPSRYLLIPFPTSKPEGEGGA